MDAADAPEVGYDVPALPGMAADEIETPALVLDLDALQRNIARMQAFADGMGVALRVHGKMHRSADVAKLQIAAGAVGVCCQKVSEAEAFARAGIADILVSNEVRGARKVDRLASLARRGVTVAVCVDDADAVSELSAAALDHGTTLAVLVEIDVGAGRCGIAPGAPAAALVRQVAAAPGLSFRGIQAYQGGAQHVADYAARKALIEEAVARVRDTLSCLAAEGLEAPVVTGAGTGTFAMEGGSGVYTEIQCGSYAFMDADYRRVLDEWGSPLSAFEQSLHLVTTVMSKPVPDRAVCDAGLKAHSVDSGMPLVAGREDLAYVKCSDEHGVIADPADTLKVGDRLALVPGHIDPTCNLHDFYVAVRGGRVEAVWPVTARGKGW